MRIFLYSTIGVDWGLEILPHWIDHYFRAGIRAQDFTLVLHTQGSLRRLRDAKALLLQFGIEPILVWRGDYSSNRTYQHRQRMWRRCAMGPADWFLIADSDEFHEFPGDLGQFLRQCDQQRYNAVEAKMIDRVAADGRLHPIRQFPTIERQFPMSVAITGGVLQMNCRKIIAHKYDTFAGRLRRGNHGIAPEFEQTTRVLRDRCAIHHYKWTAGVVEKLQCRVDHYQKIGRLTDAARSLRLLGRLRASGRLPAYPVDSSCEPGADGHQVAQVDSAARAA